MTQRLLTILSLTFSVSAFSYSFRVDTDPETVAFTTTSVGNVRYQQLPGVPLSTAQGIGLPEIPRKTFWVAVDPNKTYTVEFSVTANHYVYQSVRLYPAQPDAIDDGRKERFHIDKKAYRRNHWFGGETVRLGHITRLGPLTILPIEVTPIHYNPKRKELRIVPKIDVVVEPMETGPEHFLTGSPTEFIREQTTLLVANASETLAQLPEKLTRRVLILSTSTFGPQANALSDFHNAAGMKSEVIQVPNGTTSAKLKSTIQTYYSQSTTEGLEAVILFGNESHLPLYNWNSATPGDVYYSLLSGDDNIADIALGRLPVGTVAEADHILKKSFQFFSNLASGTARKNVMLIAHGEQYPGKYTANQEAIFNAPNPLGLAFSRQYGGKDANNATFLKLFPNNFGIINYRGHGSSTEWWAWGTDNKSLTETEIDSLNNDASDLAIYFNIACDTGAIQLSERSLAESMLFRRANEPFEGAVAVVASTEPSYTETNHRFDRYLFEGMQQAPSAHLGTIYAQANNRLVKDEGGQMPENVAMYLLLGHPLLPMPY